MLYELLWLYENPSIHLWELLGGENWRESECEFCPGEMEAPKVLPYLAFILRFFFTLYVSDPSPTTLSFRDLCWAKHAGALTGNTQNSKFTSMTIVQHFKLFLITRECFIFQWGALEIGHICQYRYMVGLRPYCPVRRGFAWIYCGHQFNQSILSIILSLLKFLIDNKEK